MPVFLVRQAKGSRWIHVTAMIFDYPPYRVVGFVRFYRQRHVFVRRHESLEGIPHKDGPRPFVREHEFPLLLTRIVS